MQISVTRGLVQLKRLEQRINKKILDLDVCIASNKKSSAKVFDGIFTKEEFKKNAMATYDSLNDLIQLRKEIKDEIVQSNAVTEVYICGKKYTVAQAIERKNSIETFEMDMARRMNRAFATAVEKMNRSNERVEMEAHKLFGSTTEDKKSELNRLEMMKLYIETNSYELIDPLNLTNLKDETLKEVEDFLSEVDQVLSESNAITMIEISKNPINVG